MKDMDAVKILLYFLLRKSFGKHQPDEDEKKLLDRAVDKLNIH